MLLVLFWKMMTSHENQESVTEIAQVKYVTSGFNSK